MRTTNTPLAALIAILAAAPAATVFAVTESIPDYDFDVCQSDGVQMHHRDTDHGGPVHYSFTCMQEVTGGGEAIIGYIYTVLDLEGKPLIVYYSTL